MFCDLPLIWTLYYFSIWIELEMELVRIVFVAHPVSSTVANVGWNCVFEQSLLLAQYSKWRSIQYLHTYGLSNTQSRSHKDAHIYIIPSIIHAYCTYGHRLLRNVVEKRPAARVVRCKYNGKVLSMRHVVLRDHHRIPQGFNFQYDWSGV